MGEIFMDMFRIIFKTKLRAFLVWYMFGYLACAYYGYTKFYRIRDLSINEKNGHMSKSNGHMAVLFCIASGVFTPRSLCA